MRSFFLLPFLVAMTACDNEGPGSGKDSSDNVITGMGCGAGEEPTKWYVDYDGDAHGDVNTKADMVIESCEKVAGYANNNDDCDDTNEGVYPGAVEVCDDLGIDYDCDPTTFAKTNTYYADTDADNYGDDLSTVQACSAPEGYVGEGGDCNDADPAFHPNADELDCNDANDYNCDGFVDFTDVDGDGTAACADCDDNDGKRAPTFGELCDGIDNNCDSFVDESTALDAQTWYIDVDKDSFGDGTGTGIRTCTGPSGYVPNGDDCNDADPEIHGVTTWYLDIDGDGYGDSSISIDACEAPPGYAAGYGDCDNNNAAVSPGVTETCDGTDNNCNGQVDEGNAIGSVLYYVDADGDGYGNAGAAQYSCSPIANYVTNDTDCDDTNAAANPGAQEVCGGGDEDCDGYVDEYGALGSSTFYADVDGDGYGDPSSSKIGCTQPAGYLSDNTDCNDTTASAHPGGIETCDATNVDEDCNGLADDNDVNPTGTKIFYTDADGDLYGAGGALLLCDPPVGSSTNNTDCDDTNVAINPGANEKCDSADNDCDGLIDEGNIGVTWYADNDGDNYGNKGVQSTGCAAPSGYVSDGTDCDDNDAAIHPYASEVCDGYDNDCDGYIDDNPVDGTTWYYDKDSDNYGNTNIHYAACQQPAGYVSDGTDCDDLDATVNPGADEICDPYDVDENCNSLADDNDATLDPTTATTVYVDADGDGYGPTASTTAKCTVPLGYSANDGDCDDADAAINPAASEVCDSANVDEDCDGLADDADPTVSHGTWSHWYKDADSDAYGDINGTIQYSCDAPTGYVGTNTDCDDKDATTNPGASEICYDGLDNNCDGVTSCGLYATYKVTDAAFSLMGANANDGAGTSVFGIGDVNKDGYDDVAVGAINADDTGTNSGSMYVFFGRAYTTNTSISTTAASFKITGPSGSARLGSAISSTDIDGDGDQDLIVGAYSDNTGGASAGAAYILNFPLNTAGYQVKSTTYKAQLVGETGSDFAGYALSGAGDVNGDGFGDVLVGAYGNDQSASFAGAAYLLYGPLSGSVDLSVANVKYMGVSASDTAGRAVSSAGDTDGDGLDDFLVASPANAGAGSSAGAVYLLLGKNVPSGAVSLGTADATIRGSQFLKAGTAISGGGDQNGDGYDDYYISCPGEDTGYTNSGSVYLFTGHNSEITGIVDAGTVATGEIWGDAKSASMANSVTHGDWDADGHDDLLIGVTATGTYGTNAGSVYVCYNLVGTYEVVDCAARIDGANSGELAGSSVATAGDFDGDGTDDILFGAPGVATVTTGAGAAYLFRGPL